MATWAWVLSNKARLVIEEIATSKRPAPTWATGETSLIELTRFNPLLPVPIQDFLVASYCYFLLFTTDLVGCPNEKRKGRAIAWQGCSGDFCSI